MEKETRKMARKTAPPTGKVGRPQVIVDWEIAEELARIHCTKDEMAAVLKITTELLDTDCQRKFKIPFAQWYQKFSSQGKMSLRRKMFEVAHSGNVTMLVWLSKQHLGMKEPAVVLASSKIEREEIAMLDDKSLEAVARRILQEGYDPKGKGIKLVS